MPDLSARPLPPLPLPEPLRGEEPGTFAENTVAVRLPEIGRRTLAENDFPPETAARVQALVDELPHGQVRLLRDEAAPDREAWAAYCAPYLGLSWLQAPWFFAETYFYRRLLEATGYFLPGTGQGADPFALQKQLGLETSAAVIDRLSADLEDRAAVLKSLPAGERAALLQDLFTTNLWGNQADLSLWPVGSPLHSGAEPGPQRTSPSRLVVDETALIAACLLRQPLPAGTQAENPGPRPAAGPVPSTSIRIDFILDNAGLELVNDLLLADILLQAGLAQEVRLHAKAHPTFVSDALPADVLSTFDFLLRGEQRSTPPASASRRLGQRLYRCLQAGRLRLRSHFYWNSPLEGWLLPLELREELAGAELLVSKGDANYRRLVGDRHWPLETPLAQITRYLPAHLALLRVCKSEVAVGLGEGQAERLFAQDPNWMTNGNWGMIQFA
jgi:hypothetical protein